MKKKHTVIFQPFGLKAEVEEGTRLLDAAAEAGVTINSLCGGEGVCGKCRVQVLRGEAPPNAHSVKFLSKEEVQEKFVLGCQSEVHDNLEVWVPPEARLEEEQILTTESIVDYEKPQEVSSTETVFRSSMLYMPVTQKLFLSLPKPSISDNISDLDRIIREIRKKMDVHHIETSFSSLKGLGVLLRSDNWKVSVTVHPKDEYSLEIINFEPGDTSSKNYGIALDIGTTTIAAQLVDLRSGAVLGVDASHNLQARYGEDVISRIIYACNRDGMDPLHQTVVNGVNNLINGLLEKYDAPRDTVTALVAAGNTTMTHLFLGLEPCTIRIEPYIPTANSYPVATAADLGLNINPQAKIVCIPGVSSYVGGDITAGVLASGISNSPRVSALIDIGTNGEIVIGNNEWLVCCSASAGPAFEGSGTKCGMRATRGAIQQIVLAQGQVCYETIGNAPPRGICGSGLIDTIAELFRNGILDPNGKLIRDTGDTRIRVADDVAEFVLASGDETETGRDVVITENDISNLIKSKGAIMAAIQTLLESVDLLPSDLEQIYVAGGFGNYLDVEKATIIGLIPDVPLERVHFIGNSSLTGARAALLSTHALEQTRSLARHMTYFELSVNPAFMDRFVASLFLPHTDLTLFPSVKRMMEAQ